MRPTTLDEFVGQDRIRRILQILCRSAKAKGTAVSHVLLSGPPGLGKTSLARILAREMGSRLIETVGSNVQGPEHLCRQLLSLRPMDILFIDEIHSLGLANEEVLYGAMEDFQVSAVETGGNDFMKALGVSRKPPEAKLVQLPPFTLAAASTLTGLVSAPLRSRFMQVLTLEPYSQSDLERIALNAAARMEFKLPKAAATEVARRSRATARVAVCNLSWIVEYCTGLDVPATAKHVREAFELKGIDRHGLNELDRQYLGLLLKSRSPMGLNTIAVALNESADTLERSVEPFLIQRGLVRRESRGRLAGAAARKALDARRAA